MFEKVKAFVMGVREYQTDLTTHYDDDSLLNAYDTGRNIAKKVLGDE